MNFFFCLLTTAKKYFLFLSFFSFQKELILDAAQRKTSEREKGRMELKGKAKEGKGDKEEERGQFVEERDNFVADLNYCAQNSKVFIKYRFAFICTKIHGCQLLLSLQFNALVSSCSSFSPSSSSSSSSSMSPLYLFHFKHWFFFSLLIMSFIFNKCCKLL